jgi:hypothetical protein
MRPTCVTLCSPMRGMCTAMGMLRRIQVALACGGVWHSTLYSTLSSRLEAKTYDTSHCEMIETSVTLEFAFVHMIVEYDSRWDTCAACRVRVCRNTDITVGVRINLK